MPYALNNVKWGGSSFGSSGGLITYSVSLAGLVYDTSRYVLADFEAALADAFEAWENVSDIAFEEVASGADVELFFAPIDGPSRVVGEATYRFFTGDPGRIFEGQIEFDTAETWSPTGETGISFQAVATHEIGHVLGLEHVADRDEIMYPIIRGNDLGSGDIAGVQFLYGILELFGDAGANVLDRSGTQKIVALFGEAGDDFLTGSENDDRLYGGTGDDTSRGEGGADLIVDLFGFNLLNGGGGNDLLIAGAGGSELSGDSGEDVLLGGFGNDTLTGGPGFSVLVGDGNGGGLFGNDRLVAGTGTNLMEGGGGADVFVFAPGGGDSTIGVVAVDLDTPTDSRIVGTDFDPLVDRIDLTAFGFIDQAQIDLAITDEAGSAVFRSGGTEFAIRGVSEAELLADTFIF